jgi:hypothetical protein
MSDTRCHTFTGSGFDPFEPRAEDVRLEDIAHHLSMTCRYGGASPWFYSVAEHAVRVARLLLQVTGDYRVALHGLHHDDAEAYIHDIRRPIKARLLIMGGGPHGCACSFELAEAAVQGTILQALQIPEPCDTERNLVKCADNALLLAEMELFGMPNRPNLQTGGMVAVLDDLMGWQRARDAFLRTHRRIRKVLRP